MRLRVLNLFNRSYRHVVILSALAFGLMIHCTPSYAADFALYGCKDDMGSSFVANMSKEDPSAASSMAEMAPVNVFRFDFVNKTVTYRMLDSKGKEFGMLGVGKTSKYTADIKIAGDKITWSHVDSESAQGKITENNTFNRKTGKLHGEMVMKPSNGDPPTSIPADMTCTPYTFKHNQK